jgi:hypothetical protein
MANKNRLNNINSELNKLIGSKNNRKNNTVKSVSSGVFVTIGIILLVIVLCVIGYFLYNYFTNIKKQMPQSALLIPYIRDASIYKSFSNSSIPQSISGNSYNINMWLYINTYSYRIEDDKCILFKGDVNSSMINNIDDIVNEHSNPSIWLKSKENTLVVQVGLDTILNGDSGNSNGNEKVDKCEFKNFPLQKWVNLNVSMRNNVLDIFIDGTLVKSCILKGSPTVNSGDLHVFNQGPNGYGFNGYISRLEYTNNALDSYAIMDRYKKGPVVNIGSSLFNLSL